MKKELELCHQPCTIYKHILFTTPPACHHPTYEVVLQCILIVPELMIWYAVLEDGSSNLCTSKNGSPGPPLAQAQQTCPQGASTRHMKRHKQHFPPILLPIWPSLSATAAIGEQLVPILAMKFVHQRCIW